MTDDLIREERKRLRIQREKDLHNGLVERLRQEPAEENWNLAESVFTPEEMAERSGRIRREGVLLMLDTAVFWLSILILSGIAPSADSPFPDPSPVLEVFFISLIFVSFFAWFVLFFRSRSLKQDFTREFALRIERKRKAGNRSAVPAREIGFRRESPEPKETTP